MRSICAFMSTFVMLIASPLPLAAQARVRPLPCAGHSLTRLGRVPRQILREHPDLRPGGVSIRCNADSLTLLEWGNDSSSQLTLPRDRAIRVWRRFVAARTYEASYRVFFELLAAESRPAG